MQLLQLPAAQHLSTQAVQSMMTLALEVCVCVLWLQLKPLESGHKLVASDDKLNTYHHSKQENVGPCSTSHYSHFLCCCDVTQQCMPASPCISVVV